MSRRSVFGVAAMKRRVGILLAGTVLCLAAAPAAQAAFSMTPQVDFATDPIAVGSSGAGSLAFSNDSTAGETALFIDRIVLEPSCRNPGESPPCTNREPGIFSIGSATGALGTSCQGITFTVSAGTAPFVGSLEFTPQTPIPSMPVNATCVINFTYAALAVPTIDTQADAGIQTDQLAVVRGDNGGGPTAFGPATGDTTVSPAPPVTPPVTNPPASPPVTTPPPSATGQRAAALQKCKKKFKKDGDKTQFKKCKRKALKLPV